MGQGGSNPHDGGADAPGCIVCADSGVPMRVVSLEGSDAGCVDDHGGFMTVAVDFLLPVEIGETLLVHGGAAIGRVERVELGPGSQSAVDPFVERRDFETRPWTGSVQQVGVATTASADSSLDREPNVDRE